MQITRYLPALRGRRGGRNPRLPPSPGERVLASLLPSRGWGWPGGWNEDRYQQVQHLKNWVYVAVDTICGRLAGISPNLAYVTDAPAPGQTVKAGCRALWNLMDSYGDPRHKRLGGSPTVTGGGASHEEIVAKTPWAYDRDWAGDWAPRPYGDVVGFSDGGHSWLTVGEYRSKALSVVKPHEELEPLESYHTLRRLMENPNDLDTFFDLEYELQMFEEICGVSYEWLVPNQWGVPCERWCIPSHWCWPRTGGGDLDARVTRNNYEALRPGGGLRTTDQEVGDYARFGQPYGDPWRNDGRLILYYEVHPWGGDGGGRGMLRLPPDEVVMTVRKSPLSKVNGYSPLSATSMWVDEEEANVRARWASRENLALPGCAVELGPGYEDPDDDRIARYEQRFIQKFQGEWNTGKPIFTPPGSKITPLSWNPDAMRYVETEDQQRDMILSAYRVPGAAVGLVKEMTYGSILATVAAMCSNCLNVRLARKGAARTKHLGSRWDQVRTGSWSQGTDLSFDPAGGLTVDGRVLRTYGGRQASRRVRIWYDDCVPVDPAQVNSDIQTDSQAYAITPNEVRALRGRKPYDHGGDDPMGSGPGGAQPVPLNTGESLDELAELIAPMAQAEGQADQPGQGGAGQGALGGQGEPLALPAPGEGGESANALVPAEAGRTAEQGEAGAGVENPAATTDLAEDVAGVREPNQKPHKSYQGATDRPPLISSQAGPGGPIAAGLAVVADDTGRVLMLHRPLEPDDPNSGRWEFPSGKLEEGEEPWEAAAREWEEEVGLALPEHHRRDDGKGEWLATNGKYAGYVLRVPSESHLDLDYRLPDPDGSGGRAMVAWVDPRDVPHHNLRPALLGDIDQVLQAVVKHLAAWVERRSPRGVVTKDLSTPARLLAVPDYPQRDDYSCGAMAAASVGNYFGVGPDASTDEGKEEWKRELHTTRRASTFPDAIVAYLRELGLDARGRDGMTLDDLRAAWGKGLPVICPVREYGTEEKPTSLRYGHWVVAVGVDLGFVFVQDPSIDNVLRGQGVNYAPGKVMLEEQRWLGVWHDTDEDGRQYVRYGIVVGPGGGAPGPVSRLGGSAVVRKGRGAPCKPGETEANTGCKPAGGGGGRGESQEPHPSSSTGGVFRLTPKEQVAARELGRAMSDVFVNPSAAGLKGAVAGVRNLVGGWVWSRLSPKEKQVYTRVTAVAMKVEHFAEGYYKAGQDLAKAVAREGCPTCTQDVIDGVARTLAYADLAARWGPNIPVVHAALEATELVGGPVAFGLAKVGYYTPVASLAYVGFKLAQRGVQAGRAAGRMEGAGAAARAAVKSPYEMLKNARERVKVARAKEREHGGH